MIAEGWTHSVGVAGWSTGGGHGPFAGWAGLGVDNLLEVELVTANGTLVTANANSNSDLYWALRGGGGSNWGVMTRMTIRAHAIPAGGFHQRQVTYAGVSGLLRNELLRCLLAEPILLFRRQYFPPALPFLMHTPPSPVRPPAPALARPARRVSTSSSMPTLHGLSRSTRSGTDWSGSYPQPTRQAAAPPGSSLLRTWCLVRRVTAKRPFRSCLTRSKRSKPA
jgi:hypothetical protein